MRATQGPGFITFALNATPRSSRRILDFDRRWERF